jgi:hypothetical protein
MMVPTRTHTKRHTLIPRHRRAVAGDGRAESDNAACVGDIIPAPAAIDAPNHGDSSASPPEGKQPTWCSRWMTSKGQDMIYRFFS